MLYNSPVHQNREPHKLDPLVPVFLLDSIKETLGNNLGCLYNVTLMALCYS